MRKTAVLFLTLFALSFNSKAQVSYRDSVLNIDPDNYAEDELFSRLMTCGNDLDTFDLLFFKDGALGLIIFKMAQDEMNTEGKVFTYGDVYNEIVKTRDEYGEEYELAKEAYVWMIEIMAMTHTDENWKQFKDFMIEQGATDRDLDEYQRFFEPYKNGELTYQEIIIDITSKPIGDREEWKEEEKKRIAKDLFSSTGETLDLQALSAMSKTQAEPIVVYFTGFACVNCRKMEKYVLDDVDILELLESEFVFKSAYVDDRKELSEDLKQTVEVDGRTMDLKTVGDYNLYLQLKEYKVSSQPLFVFLDSDLNVLFTTNYEDASTTSSFLTALYSALETFYYTSPNDEGEK